MRSSATHSERERFVADLVRHAPAADSVIAGRLMRYAGAYHRLATREAQLTFAELRKLERIRGKFEVLCEQVCGLDLVCSSNLDTWHGSIGSYFRHSYYSLVIRY